MWESRRFTTLWASTVRYRDSFTFSLPSGIWNICLRSRLHWTPAVLTQAQDERFVKLTTQLHLLQESGFHSSVARQSDSRSFAQCIKKQESAGRWRELDGDIKVRLSLCLIVPHTLKTYGACRYSPMYFTLGTRSKYVVTFTPQSIFFPEKSLPHPRYERLIGTLWRREEKSLPSAGNRTPVPWLCSL
jgi:hypothetical protein